MEKFGNRLYWFVILFKYTLKLEVRYNLLLILLLGARRHKPPSEHPQIEAIRKKQDEDLELEKQQNSTAYKCAITRT